MSQVNLEYLFKNLKSGDMIGFHYKPWYYFFAKVIKLFTHKKDNLAIEHIGICYNVAKSQDELSFSFGEQLTSTGRTNSKIIIKYDEITKIYFILKDAKKITHLFSNKITFYLLENKHKLNKSQNLIIADYFDKKEKYNVASAIASVPFFEKIFKVKDKNKDNYCSGAVHTALNQIGIGLDIKDTLPSPAELSTFSYIANIYKINQ